MDCLVCKRNVPDNCVRVMMKEDGQTGFLHLGVCFNTFKRRPLHFINLRARDNP